MATRIGRFFKDFFLMDQMDQVEGVVETATGAFELAEALNKDEIKKLAPMLEQGGSLLEVLNSPLAELAESSLPFVKVATGLLRFYIKVKHKEPDLAQQVVLISQAAYLESFKDKFRPFLTSSDARVQQWLSQQGQKLASDKIKRQMKQFEEIELDDKEARRSLLFFQTSTLAVAFNQVLAARLIELDFKPDKAKQFAENVASNTSHYLDQALEEMGESVRLLREWYRGKSREEFEKYLSIDEYLDREIRSRPDEPLFDEETITFRDLYVPLKVKPLNVNGHPTGNQEDLETWVSRRLQELPAQILFIQGEGGRGKSAFCRMFADRVRRELHPTFTPIVIRLRRLTTLENTLSATLASYETLQTSDFVASDAGWLTDKTTRFLFFLDGFDELLLEDRAGGGLKEFLQQVDAFQQNSHHRFIVTGRPLALQGIDRLITQIDGLDRVEIQPMDDELQQTWLEKWKAQVGEAEAIGFWNFLQACPADVKDKLAREPLLLYLLARMHREQQLHVQMFAQVGRTQAKIFIYDAVVNWMLQKQRQHENLRLTGLESEELRRVLMEAALCVVQSGNEFTRMTMLEARLKHSNSPVVRLIQQARQSTAISEERVLNNLLTTFYLKPASGDKGGAVEFAHKSFGEFLFAERLKEAIEDWTEPGKKREKFYLNDEQMDRQVYDLLGYGALTREIVDYLMGLLSQSPDFKPVQLFDRLHRIYENWCDGEYIDQPPSKNFPQDKMLQLQGLDIPLGLRQVDVYTGLNVMILLLELHRYARSRDDLEGAIVFKPCYKAHSEPYGNPQLQQIISYARCLNDLQFVDILGDFLSTVVLNDAFLRRTNLSRANLKESVLSNTDFSYATFYSTDLSSADLRNASLIYTNLSGAILTHANLNRANLRKANLNRADLSDADLGDADLSDADLSSANLNRVNLSGANLIGSDLRDANLRYTVLIGAFLHSAILGNADLSGANLKGILWDKNTQWEGIRGVESAVNIPEKLKRQLGLTRKDKG